MRVQRRLMNRADVEAVVALANTGARARYGERLICCRARSAVPTVLAGKRREAGCWRTCDSVLKRFGPGRRRRHLQRKCMDSELSCECASCVSRLAPLIEVADQFGR